MARVIHAGSGRSLENRAMKNEPTTKPTEVRPSCSPYWNSVAPRTFSENGSRSTFHSPNEKNISAATMKIERMTGVPISVTMPAFRFGGDDPHAGILVRLRHRIAAHQRDAAGREQERRGIEDERPLQPDRAGQQPRAGEPDRGRAE